MMPAQAEKHVRRLSYGLVRALFYSALISTVIFFIVYFQSEGLRSIFYFVALAGLVIILVDSLFTVLYLNRKKTEISDRSVYRFSHHGINHLFYPLVYYVGLVYFIAFQENMLLCMSLAFLSFVLYFFYFYSLPTHVLNDHVDEASAKPHSVRVEYILEIFKYLSYFALHLGLFETLAQSRITINSVFVVSCFITFVYLYLHISRRGETSRVNTFITVLFALVTGLFIVRSSTGIADYSAAIATVIFYLTSGIYSHKADGTFNYRVLIEYLSIALILSVFLFAQ